MFASVCLFVCRSFFLLLLLLEGTNVPNKQLLLLLLEGTNVPNKQLSCWSKDPEGDELTKESH